MIVNADEVLEAYLRSDSKVCTEWEKFQKLKNDPRITKVGRILEKPAWMSSLSYGMFWSAT